MKYINANQKKCLDQNALRLLYKTFKTGWKSVHETTFYPKMSLKVSVNRFSHAVRPNRSNTCWVHIHLWSTAKVIKNISISVNVIQELLNHNCYWIFLEQLGGNLFFSAKAGFPYVIKKTLIQAYTVDLCMSF